MQVAVYFEDDHHCYGSSIETKPRVSNSVVFYELEKVYLECLHMIYLRKWVNGEEYFSKVPCFLLSQVRPALNSQQ